MGVPLPGLAVALALLGAGVAALAIERVALAVVRPPRMPPGRTPDDLSLDHDDVVIPGPVPLRGWLLHPPEDAGGPVLVLSHGWAANASVLLGLAAPLVRAGHPVVVFDFRAHGRSEAAPYVTVRQYRDDMEAAARWARERFPGRPLVLGGHSMGGAAAVLVAAGGVDAAGVVLLAAPADVFEVTAGYLRDRGLPGDLLVWLCRPSWRLRMGVPFAAVAPERMMAGLDAEVLVVQPEHDRRVPREHAERLARPAGTEPVIVPDASHTEMLERPETARLVQEFVAGLAG